MTVICAPVTFAHGLLRRCLVVPEIAIRAQRLQLGKARCRDVEINMLSKQVNGRRDDVDLGLRFSLHVVSVSHLAGRAARSSAGRCSTRR